MASTGMTRSILAVKAAAETAESESRLNVGCVRCQDLPVRPIGWDPVNSVISSLNLGVSEYEQMLPHSLFTDGSMDFDSTIM